VLGNLFTRWKRGGRAIFLMSWCRARDTAIGPTFRAQGLVFVQGHNGEFG
jgi:hypothetical protein